METRQMNRTLATPSWCSFIYPLAGPMLISCLPSDFDPSTDDSTDGQDSSDTGSVLKDLAAGPRTNFDRPQGSRPFNGQFGLDG